MSPKQPVRVAVTGAAGNVSYALLFRLASGQVLGHDQPIELRLQEIEPVVPALEGVVMELDDSAFSLVRSIDVTSEYKTAFDGASLALLVGSVPRKDSMERKDLLSINGSTFRAQGEALAAAAAADVRILVVGNPCNTNCLVARENARDIPADRWFAMTRLDQNRATAQLAHKAQVPVRDVRNVAIWGNHSSTQFPDFANARIGDSSAVEVIDDEEWLKNDFIETIQQRGAAIIKARGASSAASAANAAIDSVRSIYEPTPDDDNAALAVTSRGEYGIPEGLQFGFPVRSSGDGWSVIEGFEHDDFAQEKIAITTRELEEEREAVRDLLPSR
ncbi:MAG: malate dehydrogenase [Actinomycetota bacterium]